MEKQLQRPKVLVVDDTPLMRDAITQALNDTYNLVVAHDGIEALNAIKQHPEIECIVMDLMMPHLDGFKTTHLLKSNFTTYHIPIMILTSQVSINDMLQAVALGADDYMKKPFDPLELKARVGMNIRRSLRDQNANPLTKLPGNAMIEQRINNQIPSPIAVMYADLDNFKAYNDKYGYQKGDEIIIYTAQTLAQAIKSSGGEGDFLGHIGGDDFIMVSVPERAEAIAAAVCSSFDTGINNFYNDQDKAAGKIISTDRQGNVKEFPLVSISIAIITNEKRPLASSPQIAQIAAELKKYAKSKPGGVRGSNYVKDRRGDQ